jgi:two-component system sensor histidine kinase KdpD
MALRFQRLTIVWAATLSALAWDYFFTPPLYTLLGGQPSDWLILGIFYVVTLFIGLLTTRIRLQALAERRRDQRTQALYSLAQSGVESTNLDEAIRRVMQEISGLFQAQAAILLTNDEGELAKKSPADWIDDKEEGVATWAFLNNHPAGRFTDTLPESQAIYLPLSTTKGKNGVLALRLADRKSLGLEERELLAAITDQVAVMVERYLLIQQATQARLAEESERISNAIFDSISHELKTPLDAIAIMADKLGAKRFETVAERSAMAEEVREAGVRLRRTVDNLLGMSRIESGRLQLKLTWCEVAELVQAARQQVADVLANHRVRGTLGPDLPLVKLDFGLMVHALSNVLTNAALYSPAGSEIRISAHIDNHNLVLRISDEGPGLPAKGDRIFEKFYRGPNALTGGSGLGLSIVRALVQAHGGEVTAEDNPHQGATFTVRVPVGVTPLGKETTLA